MKGDHASKDWLHTFPTHQSSSLEWWLSGALLGLLLLVVVVKYADATPLDDAHAYCKVVNAAWVREKGFVK
jgi:hypothetical protein